ncbi:MAG: hypothetical protein L0G99_17665, partial [Propionibacteriales bacterium]|nr:hypothetical protein [Propionibacteriales bacterium]
MKIRSALMTVLVVAVMMLGSGCAPSRDLPDQPPLKDLQSINLCALAPPEQVKIDVSDAIGRGWMRQSLGACWFTTPNGSLWMEQANDRAELPDAVLKEDSETEVQSVTGGRILNSRSGSSARCSQRTLISDRGYVINLNAGASVGDAQCQVLDK